jgi:solute carrier family 39 (zinc transporter), member 9
VVHDTPESNNHATITMGLIIHAAMDGVALGAAIAETEVRGANGSGGNLGLIVFWGLMLHKGPAAFSLCTFLLNAGLTHRKILVTMSLFSLAAPMAAIVTCLGLLWYR